MTDRPQYQSQVLDHLGLVAGMFDELGIGDILDQATQQDPQTRDLTVGEAVKAMVLNGLGLVNQTRYLVPMFSKISPPTDSFRLVWPPSSSTMMRWAAPSIRSTPMASPTSTA